MLSALEENTMLRAAALLEIIAQYPTLTTPVVVNACTEISGQLRALIKLSTEPDFMTKMSDEAAGKP